MATTECVECDEEFAAVTADDDTEADTGDDPRGTQVTMWGPQLLAPIDAPTGDKRRFAAGSLTNRDLPVALRWQRQGASGHDDAVVVGTVDGITYDEQGTPFGFGLLFDPDPEQLPRLAQDTREASLLWQSGTLGPSVDLDDMEYHAVTDDAGEYADGTRPEINVTRGRISSVTLVPIPAFAEAGAARVTLTKIDPEEYQAKVAAYRDALTASVRATGWSGIPLADPGTAWDASAAQKRIKDWAGDDMAKYGRAFLWSDPDAGDNLGGYKFPIADVIDGALKVVPKAVSAALAVLAGGRGGTVIPAPDQKRMKSVLAGIQKRYDPDQDGDDDRSRATDTDHDTYAANDDTTGDMSDAAGKLPPWVRKKRTKKTDPDQDGDDDTTGEDDDEEDDEPPARRRARRMMRAMTAAALSGDWEGIMDDDLFGMDVLTAAATGLEPMPRAWFENPNLDKPTPLTITEDGRVFGHVADWKRTHMSLPGVRPPKSPTGYAYFHTGEVVTDEGPLAVGRITVGGGHADSRYGYQAAVAHYDDVSTVAAVVRAGDDRHGIWVAGALAPGVKGTEKEFQLRMAPLSGDWRRVGSGMELITAHAVVTGGFPIPRASLAASGAVDPDDTQQMYSLVAAGALPPAGAPTDGAVDVLEVARAAAVAALEARDARERNQRAGTLMNTITASLAGSDAARRRQSALEAARRLTGR